MRCLETDISLIATRKNLKDFPYFTPIPPLTRTLSLNSCPFPQPLSMAKNIPRTLGINLLYPAFLGTFLYSVIAGFFQPAFYRPLLSSFETAPLLAFLKIILLLVTLTFYLCDFINSSLFPEDKYGPRSLALDIISILSLVVAFQALRPERGVDSPDGAYISIPLFCGSMFVFMISYIVRYWVKKGKMSDDEKIWYKELAEVEGVYAGGYLIIGVFSFFSGEARWFYTAILSLAIANIILVCFYIWVIKKNHQDKVG